MQPYIRGGVLENFPDTARKLGGDPAKLLELADVAPEVISVPGIFLPYANYMRLMAVAAKATGTPHFGLLMSRSGNAETLGTVGMIMSQADTVGAAWDTLSYFYRLHDTYGQVRLYRYPDTVMISYGLPRNDQPGTRQVYDVGAGVTANIMRQLCGSQFLGEEIRLPFAEPVDLSPYAELPYKKTSFGASSLEIHVSAKLMAQPIQGRSEELRDVLDGYFARQLGNQRSFSQLVEDMIRRLLPTGECTLPHVAETLATSQRTLQVRLDQEGTSFRQLLEDVRRQIATFHLRRGDMQLTQLAMVLGYSELSAFSRSFRGWYGMSPRRWVQRGDWRA